MGKIVTGIIFFAVGLGVVILGGCRSDIHRPDVTPEMRDAYESVAELYRYVWNPATFANPESKTAILNLLERLIKDFHRVESKTPLPAFEPGFTVALREHREMLVDIRSRFAEGAYDYASSRLKSLAGNCVACHNRLGAPVDFLGAAPASGVSVEQRYIAGQFFFAANEFEKSGDALERVDDFRAMQLWLAAQIRLKAPFLETAAALEKWSARAKLDGAERAAVENWIRELKELENRPRPAMGELSQARSLLGPVETSPSIEKDILHLVKTLQAASILQEIIQGMPLSDARRQSLYLLAVAYVHTPIEGFEVLRDMYLEQTVREFPNSLEARRAFDILEDLVEGSKGSSADLNLSRDQMEKLKQLRSLAYGRLAEKRSLSSPS